MMQMSLRAVLAVLALAASSIAAPTLEQVYASNGYDYDFKDISLFDSCDWYACLQR